MHTSGLVLDFYDDKDAVGFKELYPTRGEIPDLVKTAHVLSYEEREKLPDDVFALVMVQDDGQASRKYACVDPGNTVLAVEYFMGNRAKLPEEAQKVAAANLVRACAWYDITPPVELCKVAGLVMTGANLALTVPGTQAAVKDGAARARASGGMINPALMGKHADATGTSVMPLQQNTTPASTSKAVIKKTAEQLEQGKAVKGTQAVPHQHKQLTPHVNIQGAEPPLPTTLKTSSITALHGRYPLDSYEQVKAASVYFDTYYKHFSPEDRHEYCTNLVKRASVLRMPTSETIQKYGSEKYASAEELEFALDSRRALMAKEDQGVLNKLASMRASIDPEVFALALQEMDKVAGLAQHYDVDVLDPFFSTFGFTKEATYTESIGNDYVNEFMLQQLSISAYAMIKERFGEDVADEFKKDPVGIFKSLPMEQKKIFMRLAADSQPGSSES